MSPNDLYAIPSEYNDLRESVKALAAKEIAPYASAVDEEHRFPQEAADALLKAGLSAAHVPTEFGGEGADALAVVIIIEEVARVCGASSLIPAVNKLGSLPLMLGGSKEQKERWLPQLAKGKGFSYCLSESEAGSDAAALKTKAELKGDTGLLTEARNGFLTPEYLSSTQLLHKLIHLRAQRESQHLLSRNLIQVFPSAHQKRRWVFGDHRRAKFILTM